MSLLKLCRRKRLVLVGLNSGTSADGLDLAALAIDRRSGKYRITQLAGAKRPYPPALRRAVLDMADSKVTSLDEVIYLDQALGQFYGRTAAQFIRQISRRGISVDAVASHGQTVRHLPHDEPLAGFRVHGTMQLGSPDQIAAYTGKTVIGDFRQADVALGNEGAPITSAAMERLFASSRESRLIVNIGGMANFFYFAARRARLSTAAADCGPGNSLSDLLAVRLFRLPYDRGGRLARKGKVSQRLLSLLLAEPFFRGNSVSTGREAFGLSLADKILVNARKLRLTRYDTLATAAELTPLSIAQTVRPFIERDCALTKLYLTGGGVHNSFFTQRLNELLNGVTVISIASLGFDPDLVEASAYAVMGEATLRGEVLPTRFGASGRHLRLPVLGRIIQPPREE
jgi:anhydro-N-acetylmuramic acid kinase